jgi:SAM-dependent methyltransferase
MSVQPAVPNGFVERLRHHAGLLGRPGATETSHGERTPSPVQRNQLAFWNSPVARAWINRRITGDPQLAPETYFPRRHGPTMPAPMALSLRASNAKLEVALLESGPCERLIGLHEDQERVDYANSKVPEPMREQISFQLGDISTWTPTEPLGAVMTRSALHRLADLDEVLDRIESVLTPNGLIFVDEYVGPARSQWSEGQLEIINRLLSRLPDELLVDLTDPEGKHKHGVGRPALEGWVAANPQEMVRSDEIIPGLDARFERVEVSLYGGAIFHQLFSRIMGNFASRPELVEILMEVDALLTDKGVVSSDYVWGVWRRS